MKKIKYYYRKQSNNQFLFGLFCILFSYSILKYILPDSSDFKSSSFTYLFGLLFVFSGIIFFKNCVIMRFKTTKDIDNFLSDKTNNIKEIEAEYISWGNYNIVSKIINMNKVKLHINDGDNRTFFLLMNLSDYYEIIRFIQEKLRRVKYKLNLSGIPSEPDSVENHYPTIPDMV